MNTLLSQCVISENKYLLNLPEIQQTVNLVDWVNFTLVCLGSNSSLCFGLGYVCRWSIMVSFHPSFCVHWRSSTFLHCTWVLFCVDKISIILCLGDLAAAVSINYGPILHASIELDYYHCYPKGAARIVFRRVRDYIKAAQVGHVMLEIANNSHRVSSFLIELIFNRF